MINCNATVRTGISVNEPVQMCLALRLATSRQYKNLFVFVFLMRTFLTI